MLWENIGQSYQLIEINCKNRFRQTFTCTACIAMWWLCCSIKRNHQHKYSSKPNGTHAHPFRATNVFTWGHQKLRNCRHARYPGNSSRSCCGIFKLILTTAHCWYVRLYVVGSWSLTYQIADAMRIIERINVFYVINCFVFFSCCMFVCVLGIVKSFDICIALPVAVYLLTKRPFTRCRFLAALCREI